MSRFDIEQPGSATNASPPPADYLAFCELNEDLYLRYARARTGDAGTAQAVVGEVFTGLARGWPRVLRSARPARVAWRLLNETVAELAGCPLSASIVHWVLEPQQADAVLLRHHLRLSPSEVAELMGVDEFLLRSLLASGERALPRCLAAHLELPGSGPGPATCRPWCPCITGVSLPSPI